MESNINQPVNPLGPTTSPGSATGTDSAAEVYRRAIEARPTGFTENPISAMASAVDRLGGAASRLLQGRAVEGRDGLSASEERLKAANEAARANPGSPEARRNQMVATLALLRDMRKLAPNDPRRVKVASFAVRLAGELGPEGLRALRAGGLDVQGLLRQAAQISGRFGDGAAMQEAFRLEQLLAGLMPESSADAITARDALMDRLGLSAAARRLLASSWGVRLAGPGELPSLDVEGRTMVLNASAQNASLSVLARAWWQDQSLANPEDRDGFIQAFLKVASQGGVLNRKFRDVSRMARQELNSSRSIASLGGGVDAPVFAAAQGRGDDESGDMFAALAVFSREGGNEVPESLAGPLGRFFS